MCHLLDVLTGDFDSERATEGEVRTHPFCLHGLDCVEQSLGPAVGRQLPGLQGGFLTWQSPDLGSDESSGACSSVAVS